MNITENILEIKNLSKQFPGVKALDEVSFNIKKGEVRALSGENGAGKSTIIKILTGVYSHEEGEIVFDGAPVKFISTAEAELAEHLGYRSYERSDSSNYRNGKKTKKIRGNLGETEIEVPQDRDGTFEPKVVKKRQKDISGIEQKIISLYAKGMTTRQISDTIEEIYGFEVSDGMVSDITDRLLPQIEDWQNRPLDEMYPIVFIDAAHFSVRDNGQIRKLAAYVILAVSLTGHKEVLSIHIGENESAKYWLGVLNELKNRGVKDVLVICADGLSGMKEAVNTAFPQTELQRCIVHQVRNTLKYVGAKNKKEFANDLKTIYHAPSDKNAQHLLITNYKIGD